MSETKKMEQGQAEDAEYFACLRVAKGYKVPKPKDHPGLVFYHLLDSDDEANGSCSWLTWWKSRSDFDRERIPLTEPSEVSLRREGYVRNGRARSRPWWRRVGPYNLFVYAVTVVTGLVSLHQFCIWLWQPPRVAVEIATDAPTRAAPVAATFTLNLVNHSSGVVATVTVRNVVLSHLGTGKQVEDTSSVSIEVNRDVEIPKGGETRLSVVGPPLDSGRYSLQIDGVVKAGKFTRQAWPGEDDADLELRVWTDSPSIEVGDIQPLGNERKALVSGLLVAGVNPQDSVCSLVILGAEGLNVPRSLRSQFEGEPRSVGNRLKLRWNASDLTAFEIRSFRFPLVSRTAVDWSQLRPQGGCSEMPVN